MGSGFRMHLRPRSRYAYPPTSPTVLLVDGSYLVLLFQSVPFVKVGLSEITPEFCATGTPYCMGIGCKI